jgi:hypothetical protein
MKPRLSAPGIRAAAPFPPGTQDMHKNKTSRSI